MADDSDMDYDSDSDDECGLEEQYYSAKEASASVSIEEAIRALETVVEMDVDKTKWGFKALKRIAKLLLRKDHQQAMDYFGRLLAYHGSKHITTIDVDKALESLWNQYCEIATDADTRRGYCLTTLNLLQSFSGCLTRLKWLARLAQQCSSEEHHRQLADQVDDLQQVIEDAYAMDGINSDCVNEYLVDALFQTTSLFLLKKRYAHAESNLDRLKQLAEAEIRKPIECQAFIREMQARISCARGKYSESFVLLWDAKTLYEACVNAGSQRVHLHLRLLSLLLRKRNDAVRANGKEYTLRVNYAVWSDKWAMVEDIVRCFNDDDLARLRSLAKDAEAKLGHFAAVELCAALLRNRMSRRMASDNWLDTFACLSRWDVDGFHLVGVRLSNLVNTNSRALPLKNIENVTLKTVTEELASGVRLTVQAEHGSAPFCKEYSQDQTSDSFTTLLQNGIALRRVQNLLENAFVETLNLTDTFPFASYWIGTSTGTLHIQKLNHLFHSFCHPRLLSLEAFGDVRVDHLEVRFTKLDEETHDFFGPLGNAQVTRLDVKFSWIRPEAEQVVFLALCFDGHSDGPTPHFLAYGAGVTNDFLQRMVQKARESSCERDVKIELHSPDEEFLQLRTDFAEGTEERSGALRIFRFDWPKNNLRIELGLTELVALYTPKRDAA